MKSNFILLAEDDLDDAVKTRAALRAAGVRLPVYRTLDGVATIAYLKGDGVFADRESHPFPSVLLLDLKMPRAHGFQVLDWIRKNIKPGQLLVIALSGLQEMEAVRLAYEMGAQSFLTKPCSAEDIRNLMRVHSRYWQLVPEPSDSSIQARVSADEPWDSDVLENPVRNVALQKL